MFAAYSLLLSIVVWTILVPWNLLQIVLKQGSWMDLCQRLGRSGTVKKQGRKRLLIHAVSVGEAAAAAAVLRRLSDEIPDLEVVLTAGNRDGRAAARRLKLCFEQIRDTHFLPWDRAAAMSSWLQQLQPDLVAVVETELWPNLFFACRDLQIPLCIVNGRIYPKDLVRYRLAKAFFQPVISCARWIGVQNAKEKERFLQIGALPEQVKLIGDLKYDTPPSGTQPLGQWDEQLQKTALLIVAGSTHDPEEERLLQSFSRMKPLLPGLRMVLAPRHTHRAAALVRRTGQFGFRSALWSRPGNGADKGWDVLVMDQMGFLSTIYKHADLAVVGGSFINRGGHNFLEAAAHGCAIVTGPHTEHFAELVKKFQSEGALLKLNDIRDLDDRLYHLLLDATERKRMGSKARLLFESGRGISHVYVHQMRDLLEARGET